MRVGIVGCGMKASKFLANAGRYVWRELIKPLVLVGALVFPLKSAVADWNWVPTGSMKPTILEGDMVFVNKLAYDLKIPFTLTRLAQWDAPQRGDIVVFFCPTDGKRFVKRVIGVPGDTLEMRDNVLIINGQAMHYDVLTSNPFNKEVYEDSKAVVAQERHGDTAHWVMALPSRRSLRTFPPVSVPDGKYFLMGDSRDNSFDSRFFGLVDRREIVGKANGVLLSFDKNCFYIPRLNRFFSSFDTKGLE